MPVCARSAEGALPGRLFRTDAKRRTPRILDRPARAYRLAGEVSGVMQAPPHRFHLLRPRHYQGPLEEPRLADVRRPGERSRPGVHPEMMVIPAG